MTKDNRCQRKDCTSGKPGEYLPRLVFHPPGGPIKDPAHAILNLLTCSDCRNKADLHKEFLGEEAKKKLKTAFKAGKKVVPDFSLTELEWVEAEKFEGKFRE